MRIASSIKPSGPFEGRFFMAQAPEGQRKPPARMPGVLGRLNESIKSTQVAW